MAGPTHYEVYIRKTAPAPWSLLMATEDRKHAVETAEDLLRDDRAAAVRVTKETLDPDTMEFDSVTVLTRGAPEVKRKRLVEADATPNCLTPQDLYTPQARELIARVLEDWLKRNNATAFELLHRPDLVEKLEASGVELQHALQKVAVPESQALGQPVQDLMRHYQRLAEKTIERVMSAGRAGAFPRLSDRSLADLAHRLTGSANRGFLMGGIVAGDLKDVRGARAKLDRLMDMTDRAPAAGPERALCLVAIEQMLCELLGSRLNLSAVLGPSLDQGAVLAAAVRMAAPTEVAALVQADPHLALQAPPLDGPVLRLSERLEAQDFPLLAAALARLVVRELMGPRRLRPSDADGEIEILRLLAMALTATAGRVLTLDEVQNAFAERSKALVTADFVAAVVRDCVTPFDEAIALARLAENVTGASSKRSAARWLESCVTSLKFESDARSGRQTPWETLSALAALQRTARKVGLGERDEAKIAAAVGRVGGLVEDEARLVAQVVRSGAAPLKKIAALLRLAAGQTAPLGPAAERARAEALKLLKTTETRAALSAAPENAESLRPLIRAAGLAA